MKSRVIFAVTAAVALTVSLAGCAANETPTDSNSLAPTSDAPAADAPNSPPETEAAPPTTLSGTLNAGGASAQGAAMDAWRSGFQAANPQVTVNYDPAGSGTGRTNFHDGGFDFAGTDSAFSTDDVAAGGFAACAADSSIVEVPIYISPIAVGFNLPGITSLNLDADTIAKIFRGEIKTWDDSAIATQNDGVELPSTDITAVHRSDSSGTTTNFTDYLTATAPTVWTDGKVEDWPAELGGESAEKTSGVKTTITGTEGAVGYLDASQAADLGTVAIKVGDTYVAHSPEAAAAAVGKSPLQDGRSANDVVVDIDRTLSDPSTYPLLLVSYLAACETYADSSQGALVRAFAEHIISPAGQSDAAAQAGSAPITGNPDLEPKVQAAVSAIK